MDFGVVCRNNGLATGQTDGNGMERGLGIPVRTVDAEEMSDAAGVGDARSDWVWRRGRGLREQRERNDSMVVTMNYRCYC